MAVMRFRRRVFILLLAVSFVSMIFLLSMLPQKDDMIFPGQFKRFHFKTMPKMSDSVTRKYAATTRPNNLNKHPVAPVMNVLAVPQLQPVDPSQAVDNKNGTKVEDNKKTENDRKVFEKDTGSLTKNKTYELGIKVQDKTMEVGEKMKNKTLEQMVLIGVDDKRSPQLEYVARKWNLTVSFADIGNIMKDTKFLNKVDPLNLDGPILVSSHNRTANFTYSMPLKFGYCDCFERYCVCCAAVTNKRLHLNSTACSNFTFLSKSHELDLKFFMDGKLIHKALISANKSPMLCLGSRPTVADVCVHFFNMTFRVNEHNAAQTQLLGCTDLSLNLYNRTLGAFPVDCFQIPGDPNKVHRERSFNPGFNWVP